VSGLKPYRIAARGIARTFQNIRLFANMSALDNVMVGRHVRTRAGVPGAVLRGAATRAEEREIAPRLRAARLRRYRGARRATRLRPCLRRPAPSRDRARPGDRAEAPRAR